MSKITRKLLVGVATTGVCVSMLSGMAFAEEDKPTAEVSVAALSQYVFRGFAYTKDSMVVQPSMTVGYKDFSFNLWGNVDTDRWNDNGEASNNWTETDMTMAYAWAMGPVNFSTGYTYYAMDSATDTQEVYLSATLDTLLKPTLKIYRDIDHYAGWYLSLGVSHSVPITGEINLDLGAQVGYLAADEASSYADPSDATGTKEYNNFHDGLLSASLKIPVNKYISVTPQLYYSFPLSSDAEDRLKADNMNVIGRNDADFVYGGVSVSMAF